MVLVFLRLTLFHFIFYSVVILYFFVFYIFLFISSFLYSSSLSFCLGAGVAQSVRDWAGPKVISSTFPAGA
jgi:hypothetical protein